MLNGKDILNVSRNADEILPETNNIVLENKSEPTVSEIGAVSVFEDPINNQRRATLQPNIKEIIPTDYRGEEVLTSLKTNGKLDRHDANQILPETNNIVIENKSEPIVSGIGGISVFEDPIMNQRLATLQNNIKEIIRTDYRGEEVLTSFKTKGKLDRHKLAKIIIDSTLITNRYVMIVFMFNLNQIPVFTVAIRYR